MLLTRALVACLVVSVAADVGTSSDCLLMLSYVLICATLHSRI